MPNKQTTQDQADLTPRELLLKRMGVKADMVKQVTPTAKKGKETTDTEQQKLIRQQMKNSFKSNCTLIQSATWFQGVPEREPDTITKDGKTKRGAIKKDAQGNNIVDHYLPQILSGEFIVEDNGDGTHTATRFNVFKEEYVVSDVKTTKVTNGVN